jgi:hypothetical protein
MKSSDPAVLSIGELIRRLKPAQLYGVLAALIAVVGGAFALGMAVSNHRVERASALAEANRESLEKAKVNLDFFTKFLRYAITEKQRQEDGYMRYEAVHKEARDEFVKLLKRWYQDQRKVGAEFRLTPELHKSYDPAISFVILPDGEKWPIPYEVKESVIGRNP